MTKKKDLYTVIGYDEVNDVALVDYDQKRINDLIAKEVFGRGVTKKPKKPAKKKKRSKSKKR